MSEPIIVLDRAGLEFQSSYLLKNISFTIYKNEPVVITGLSGSGKTLLGKLMAGQVAPTHGEITNLNEDCRIVFVPQQAIYNASPSSRFYYQQRYDSNYGNNSPLIGEDIDQNYSSYKTEIESLLNRFSLSYILNRRYIQLSNGEGKRLQLILALIQKPAVLILDNPFIGVDKANRSELLKLLDYFTQQNITYILITSPNMIPSSARQIVILEKGSIKTILHNRDEAEKYITSLIDPPTINERTLDQIYHTDVPSFHTAIKMNRVTIQYEEKTVLTDINWEVKRGERWLIRGPNGSGKSMLLSLINGDNPKAFGQDIILFDRPKGSGESIWELKRKIGYVSPELHAHFLRQPDPFTEFLDMKEPKMLEDPYQPKTSCQDVIASGFNDQVGFTGGNTKLQQTIVISWLKFLQMEHCASLPFYQLSAGQQRLLLLARALVKNPPLLILDEPCQGLDDVQTALFTKTVDFLCIKFHKTLLYITHYDQDIPECIDHFLELNNGRIIAKKKFEKQ